MRIRIAGIGKHQAEGNRAPALSLSASVFADSVHARPFQHRSSGVV